MLSMNVFFGSFLSIRNIFLSISDTLSMDCHSESVIDLIVSVNLFSGFLL